MYWIDTTAESHGYPSQMTYMCDDSNDIDNLPTSTARGKGVADNDVAGNPCPKGSFCLCIGDSSGYFLNSNDEWVEV